METTSLRETAQLSKPLKPHHQNRRQAVHQTYSHFYGQYKLPIRPTIPQQQHHHHHHTMAPRDEQPPFKRRDAIGLATKGTIIIGSAGLFMSAIQNTLTKHNAGAFGIITKTGANFATFAAMGGSYMFFRSAAANLREKEDHWNTMIGGFVAGSIMGTRFRTMPAVLGYGAGLAVVLGIFDCTGGSLTGWFKDFTTDEVARKELLRSTHKRPLEETIGQLGEGRGIYAPGYEERRRARLTEKYSVDFTNVERR